MLRFWRDDHVLNTFYLATSSSCLDDVEWFTGFSLKIPVYVKRVEIALLIIFFPEAKT